MKTYRRIRRRSAATREIGSQQKDHKMDQPFFASSGPESFFQPSASIQRKCENCQKEEKVQKMAETETGKADEKEEEKIQKSEAAPASGNSFFKGTSNYILSIGSKGQSLPNAQKQFFAARMGNEFSDVKIHTDKEASKSAREIGAQAYTYKNHVVFGEGKYQPDTSEGKKLLAHELTHVIQQNGGKVHRLAEKPHEDEVAPMPAVLPPIFTYGFGTRTDNKIAYGNCEGVSVQGVTVANYDHGTYSASGTPTLSEECDGCTGNDCITMSGNITSTFHANPTVSLPSVPAGLSECETTAVSNFINTTLSSHEQDHVNAFNTYNGTVVTPFNYTGCRDGFDQYILDIHNGIDAARIASANALSAALDPFNVAIPCDCPDPEPEIEGGQADADGGGEE